jgi:hypothetical protein
MSFASTAGGSEGSSALSVRVLRPWNFLQPFPQELDSTFRSCLCISKNYLIIASSRNLSSIKQYRLWNHASSIDCCFICKRCGIKYCIFASRDASSASSSGAAAATNTGNARSHDVVVSRTGVVAGALVALMRML